MAGRQGRQERPINPEDGPLEAFAFDLRKVRTACGEDLTYKRMETLSARSWEKQSYSSTTFSGAARGDRIPSREVVRAFILTCHWYAKSDRATAEAEAAEWDARLLRVQTELNPAFTDPAPAPADTPGSAGASGGGQAAGHAPTDPPDAVATSDTPGAWRRGPASRRARLAVGVGVCAVLSAIAWPILRATSTPGSASADALPTDAATATAPPSNAASNAASDGPDSPARLRAASPSEQPGLEKDSIGADSRCSPPNSGPGAVKWRVCTRVQADRISFALEITNRASEPVTVKARLKYTAKTAEFRTCPEAADFQILTVPAGRTLTTDTAQCSVPRTSSPTAYSGVGWVVAPDVDYGTRVLSPGAHVYPGEVHWTPDVL
ncbi:hypothetical protein AB0469_37170 [Streptomyces sp. NPDC093801]|uniref:hypothetical protein n=1 Tax=Streptomyces sp. NPDC093801 TaxID=3155203 RepID=UPI00344D88C2